MTSRAEALGGQVTTNKFKAGGCGSIEDVVAALREHPSSAAVQGAPRSRLGSHSGGEAVGGTRLGSDDA